MTLEEMIRFVEQDLRYAEMDVPHNVPKYEAIIAALRRPEALERAGHGMRAFFYGAGTFDQAIESAQAWDAATKGDGNEVNFKAGAPRDFSKIYGEDK